MDETRFQAHCKARLSRSAVSLLLSLRNHMPAIIVANDVMMLFTAALGYCGEYLSSAMGKWMLERIRASSAFCSTLTCDNEVPIIDSHLAICDACDQDAEDFGARNGFPFPIETIWGAIDHEDCQD